MRNEVSRLCRLALGLALALAVPSVAWAQESGKSAKSQRKVPDAAAAKANLKLESVKVHLFMEDSGTLSPDVTTMPDFIGFNASATGASLSGGRFSAFVVVLHFSAPEEVFAEGRQASVDVIDVKTKRVLETQLVQDVFVGPSGRAAKPVWIRDRVCQPLDIRVTAGRQIVTKRLEMNCGE